MAKVGFWLQGSTGKLAGSALQKGVNGTVIREIVKPKNPKTTNQILQRVLMNTVSQGYSALKDICSHAFQGVTEGAPSMARFQKANLGYFRERASEISEDQLSAFVNFVPVGQKGIRPARFIVSEGTLPRVPMTINADAFNAELKLSANTYAAVLADYNLQRGDQLTFVAIEESLAVPGEYVCKYARIILDPRNADGTEAPLSSQFIDDAGSKVNLPNSKNAGNFGTLGFGMYGMYFTMQRNANVCAVGCIVSRKDGEEWKRSNCQLIVSEDAIGEYGVSLARAIDISRQGNPVYMTDANAYLNNAGVSGTQSTNSGQGSSEGETAATKTYNNSVDFGSTTQNVAGGSVSVNGPIDIIEISGSNLAEGDIVLSVPSGTVPNHEIAYGAQGASITFDPALTAGKTIRVSRKVSSDASATLWFTLNVTQPSGGGTGGEGDEP